MTKLFTAKYESDEDVESFTLEFDEIDELLAIVEPIEDDYFIDRDDIKITWNSNADEGDEIVKFLYKLNDLTMDEMVNTYDGDYDDYLENGDLFYQFMYLTEYNSYDAETAMEKADDVSIYQGDAEDYVEQFTKDCNGEIPQFLEFYINWEQMASDFVRDGELLELDDIVGGDNVWVTNGNSM